MFLEHMLTSMQKQSAIGLKQIMGLAPVQTAQGGKDLLMRALAGTGGAALGGGAGAAAARSSELGGVDALMDMLRKSHLYGGSASPAWKTHGGAEVAAQRLGSLGEATRVPPSATLDAGAGEAQLDWLQNLLSKSVPSTAGLMTHALPGVAVGGVAAERLMNAAINKQLKRRVSMIRKLIGGTAAGGTGVALLANS